MQLKYSLNDVDFQQIPFPWVSKFENRLKKECYCENFNE